MLVSAFSLRRLRVTWALRGRSGRRRVAPDLRPYARRVEKPWGWEIIWAEGGPYTGKLIHIERGQRLSLQYHEEKLETLCLATGRVVLITQEAGGELHELLMEPGKGYTIAPFQLHRLAAIEDADVYEVSTPEVGRTVRVSDDYQRPDETEALRANDRGVWRAQESDIVRPG